MEPNHDSEWLHKKAELEDGADCSVGSPASEEDLKKLEEAFPVDMGIAPVDEEVAKELESAVGPEILAEVDKAIEESEKNKSIPKLTADQKQLLKNRVKRMQKKIAKMGKLHTATKVGEIIVMSDRHYQVAKDGSFRFVRMVKNNG